MNCTKAIVQMISGIKGFTPTTYAVWQGESLIKIFPDKKSAKELADELNKQEA